MSGCATLPCTVAEDCGGQCSAACCPPGDPDAPHCVAGDGACFYDGETAWTATNQECRGCTEAAREYERESLAMRRSRYAPDRMEER